MRASAIGPGPRTVLVTGMSGAGVTTSAGALAMVAARSGHKTLLLSADGPARLSTALGVEIGDDPAEVECGLYGLPLGVGPWVRRTWGLIRPALRAAAADLGIEPELVGDLAGSTLAVALLRLAHLRACLGEGRWDVVVADLGPIAQAIDLLSAPERLRDLVERAFPVGRRVDRAVRAGAARREDALLAGLPNLAAHLDDLHQLVETSNTISYVVTSPVSGATATADVVAALSLFGQDVAGVLVNRMVPPGPGAWQAGQSAADASMLAELEAGFGGGRVVRGLAQLPAHLGGRSAAVVPDELSARVVDLPLLDPRPPRGVQVSRVDGGFEWRLALPGVRAGDIDLRRRGDDLVIGLAGSTAFDGVLDRGRARVLRLPSALRRCEVVGARLRDGQFVVTFRPDRGLWSESAFVSDQRGEAR